MNNYNHKDIEQKWQKKWSEDGINATTEDPDKEKFYVLDMFPYPSGEGLHVGHPKGYIATDIIARHKKMNGYNVLHPMGWDAFGLPAENYAIKNKVHPRVAVDKNIERFKSQLEKIGLNHDWNREINTTDPAYYKWTQWIFLKLYEKGLAYESHEPINWCPSCKTGLANEDLENGKCERCGSVVEKKPLRQWVLKIREYADRLLEGIDDLAWPESIKLLQKNWIGKSEGAELTFSIKDSEEKITVFTTRPDTLFGATYMVLAPEHALVEKLSTHIQNQDEVTQYVLDAKAKDEIERTSDTKEKTGVQLEGVLAINPANQEEIPVFIADYVLAHYGTGAIMAVPAHDERDFAFATKYGIEIRQVISSDTNQLPIIAKGKLINSAEFDGLDSEEAKEKITQKVGGEMRSDYKLRDWVFSRQRYWGEPIPLIHCDACGVVPVPEDQLPVVLPEVDSYEPTGTGESPLAGIEEWVNVPCPKCGGDGRRETNTMPQWAGSSWYYLRYIDPHNHAELVASDKEKKWSPVDLYVGGAEHATRHLIYARFWHKFLYDINVVNYEEPFTKLQHVGLINAEDGRKMSKRWGNVINPDDVIEQLGADTLRVYEMFMGPFDQSVSWSTDGIVGPRRFLERIWGLQEKISGDATFSEEAEVLFNQTIKKVGEDIETLNFNTAISQLMICVNALEKEQGISQETYQILLQLLAPFAPHITEDIWHQTGKTDSIHLSAWPQYDPSKIVQKTITVAIQVNGKVRGSIEISLDEAPENVISKAKSEESVAKWLEGQELKKEVYVPGKIVNFVF